MLNTTFKGVLSKLNEKGGEQAFTQLSIKHTSDVPTFFESINNIFSLEHIKFLEEPEKAKVFLTTKMNVNITFDSVSFSALLVSVQMTKKEKKGEVSYDCEMRFEKEINDENGVLGINYLNRKEDNGEGKMKLLMYDVKIERTED